IEEGTGKMGLNTQLAGKKYEASVVTVTDEAIRNYAAATNEDNPAFVGSDPFAPPAFPIVPAAAAIASVMFDQELGVNLPLLVHGEEDHLFHAPIRAGDQLTVQSTLESVELKETGETFTILTTLTRPDNELVAEVRSLMFIRGSGSGSGSKATSAPAPERAEPLFQTVQKIDDDQTYRYAEASGDHNLIHVDPDFAVNMAGLPGIIVHGMCTMAFAGKAVLDALAGGDPKRLRRIKVRFSKPVFPGQTITTQGWLSSKADGVSTFDFETINPDGVPVIRNGVAEVVD
ncbi:MAG TPA: MaoC/PaaZ C-terminal domain-containing protein, partial [Actinomycetota bacterium]|nr:MaoC/PaaZ C-terminal domain-containing protein [Actinomycetota bacterium]